MRQHDHVECATRTFDPVKTADRILQLRNADQRRGSQRPDGNHQFRGEDCDLPVEVCATPIDLDGVRHPVTTALRVLAGEAADDRGDVHRFAKPRFIDAQNIREPAEEPLSGGVGERAPVFDLVRPGRLTDEHHARAGDGSCNRSAEDVRACPAGEQSFEVSREWIALR